MVLTLIAIGEIAFWLVLGAGLALRYLLRRRRLSAAVLLLLPAIDVGLLAATAIDLRDGGEAEFAHGLAFAYLGVTVAFGKSIVRWADDRFAHRFADGPPPWRPPRHGREKVLYEWRMFGRSLLAWAIGCGLIAVTLALVGDAERTEALQEWLVRMTIGLGIALLWPVTATIAPPRPHSGR